VAKLAGLLTALLGVLALLWIAAEMHYRNCVSEARAIPETRNQLQREFEVFSGEDSRAKAVRKGLAGCSRLPF